MSDAVIDRFWDIEGFVLVNFILAFGFSFGTILVVPIIKPELLDSKNLLLMLVNRIWLINSKEE